MLTFDIGKVVPDSGWIGISVLAAIFEDCCDLVGGCAIGGGNG
ncbi:hypothetical protein QUA23_27435 [Microcoleus sp. Pol1C5]